MVAAGHFRAKLLHLYLAFSDPLHVLADLGDEIRHHLAGMLDLEFERHFALDGLLHRPSRSLHVTDEVTPEDKTA